MWLFSRTGFYSIVEKHGDPDTVVVRARVFADLSRLLKRHDLEETVIRTPKADYPYRIELPKAVFQVVAAEAAGDVCYTNFKNDVKNELGPERAHQYMNVWQDMWDLENKLAKAGKTRKG